MLARFVEGLKQWSGVVALFLVVTGGTAWAVNEFTGENIVDGSLTGDDLRDNSVRSADIRNDANTGALKSEDIAANALTTADLGPASVAASELSTGAFVGGDIAPSSSGQFGVAPDAVQSGEVSDGSLTGLDISSNSLTGSDISEPTLTAFDVTETGYSTCDPHDSEFIDCKELSFTLGHAMPVFATWTYGFGTDAAGTFADPPFGECRVRVDGANGVTFQLRSEDDNDYHLGGLPIADVFNLAAGPHTLGFQCREILPGSSDLVIRQLHMSAIELGFD